MKHLSYLHNKYVIVPADNAPNNIESLTVATIAYNLTVTEYLCHKLPWICSLCRNYNSDPHS